MSEEEKRAIKFIKYDMFKFEEIDSSVLEEFNNVHKIILNLIKKQQKLIEECDSGEVITENQMRWVEDKYISKDKIRDKIKELEKEKNLYFEKQIIQGRIDLLNELLEEK